MLLSSPPLLRAPRAATTLFTGTPSHPASARIVIRAPHAALSPRQPPACDARSASASPRRPVCRAAAAASGGAPAPPSTSSVTARWLLNVKFGSRADAAALLAEWITTIAVPAGLPANSARVLAGAVGAPDGRLELELRLPSISALEGLWSSLPAPAHRAWGERLARHIDGSPRWEVFYELPAGVVGGVAPTSATENAPPPPPPLVSQPPPPVSQPSSVGSAPLTAGGIAVVSASDVDAILAWSDGVGAPAAGGGRARSGDVFIPAPGSTSSNPASSSSSPPPASVGQRSADDTPFGRSGEEDNLTLGPRPDGSRVVLDWKGDPMVVRPGDNLPGF